MDKLKITDFFKSTKNINAEVVDQAVDETSSLSTQFYQACLDEQNKQCNNLDCIRKKNELKKQVGEMKKKCSEIEYKVRICNMVIGEKDTKIKSLKKEIETTHAESSTAVCQNTPPDTESFTAFSAHFSNEKLAILRSIGPDKKEDSSFVNAAVKALYLKRLDVLENKSVTGRSKGEQKKEPMTPEKRNILNRIFTERIHLVASDGNERTSRIIEINKHIKFAIININKSNRSENIDKAVCQKLAVSANSKTSSS